jgi:PAS domain-containing protein
MALARDRELCHSSPEGALWPEVPMESTMPLRNLSELDREALTRNRLAAIVHSSADAIVGETLDGIVTDWNPAAERLYGYTAEEVIGRPFVRLIPPERAAESAAILTRVLRGEHRRRRRDGEVDQGRPPHRGLADGFAGLE